MIHFLLRLFTSLFCETRIIRREHNEPYLIRHYPVNRTTQEWLQSNIGVGFFLHEFIAPDNDPAHHSHPFKWSLGIPILGGYYESRIMEDGKASTKWVGVGQINLIRHNTFNIIERLEDPSASPTWTLFVAGPRITSWGFLVPGVGYVDWKEHTKDRIYGVPTATAH